MLSLLPDQRSKSVNVTTANAWIQASNRHSGFAISKRRTGSNKSSAGIASNAAIVCLFRISDFGLRISICGLSCQRSQKRYSAKNGTNQPKLYCSFTDHSPLSSLQSPNQSAARNKTLSANASGNRSRESGAASAGFCGVSTFSTGGELIKFGLNANSECFGWGKGWGDLIGRARSFGPFSRKPWLEIGVGHGGRPTMA